MLHDILLSGLLFWAVSTATVLPKGTARVSRRFNANNPYDNWPSYVDLPLDPSYPTKAAWGVWGASDVNGALNHIMPSTVIAAAQEIRTGQSFNLNLELSFIPRPINIGRRPAIHLFQPADLYTDDVITLNTQMSTQYDGLRHYAYSEGTNTSTWRFYNDLIANYHEDVIGANYSEVLGIQQAAEKGIASRGILLDYKAWMDSQNRTFDPLDTYPVPVSELKKVAEWQGLTGNWSQPGDILLVRWGWLEAFGHLNETEKQALVLKNGGHIGLVADDDAAEWLWDMKLALVGSDNPAFELLPFAGDIDGTTRSFHEVLISGWGTSILEFIDTEKLAPALREAGRSTFFMTVQTLNIRGGIASPPNAMAII